MTVEKLKTKVRRHNMLQIGLGSALLVLAAALWFGVFIAARYVFYFIAASVGFRGMWEPSFFVAAEFTALVAYEGIRKSHSAFDLMEYTNSDFNWREGGGLQGSMDLWNPDPLADAWIATQLLFLAPRTTVASIQSLRSVIRTSSEVIEEAASIFAALKADRRWQEADLDPAIRLLLGLELIWARGGPNGLEVRFPAGMSEAELV
jgi:hypothetical protein